jgi:hypothetical protein
VNARFLSATNFSLEHGGMPVMAGQVPVTPGVTSNRRRVAGSAQFGYGGQCRARHGLTSTRRRDDPKVSSATVSSPPPVPDGIRPGMPQRSVPRRWRFSRHGIEGWALPIIVCSTATLLITSRRVVRVRGVERACTAPSVCSLPIAPSAAHKPSARGPGVPRRRRWHRALLAWTVSHSPLERVGVEGTETYGAALIRQLRTADVAVAEVDRPDRKARRTKGESDPLDANSAARGAGWAPPLARPELGTVEFRRFALLRVTAAVGSTGVHDKVEHQSSPGEFRFLSLVEPF